MVIFSDLLPIGNPKFLAGNFQPIERRYLYTSVFVPQNIQNISKSYLGPRSYLNYMQNTFKIHSMLKEKNYFHHLHKTRDKVKTYLKHSKTHSKYTFFHFRAAVHVCTWRLAKSLEMRCETPLLTSVQQHHESPVGLDRCPQNSSKQRAKGPQGRGN